MTLVELMMAVTITSMLSVVLGGIIVAVQTARDHSEGMAEATEQARLAIDRIAFMVSQAGVYQLSGEATTLGLAVVAHQWSQVELPDVLVVWSGGRKGGLAARGVQQRRPQVGELVIYTLAPHDPSRLVEVSVPGNPEEIDFREADFPDRVLALIESPDAEQVLLCDRIRVSRWSDFGSAGESGVGNVRFELARSPADSALDAVTPGSEPWNQLRWAQGIVGRNFGLRQATVAMELQVGTRWTTSSGTGMESPALPFFGSTSYRYVYHPTSE